MMPAQEGFSLRAREARSMFWIARSRGALQLLAFATTLFIARILVPADYGVMALAAEVLGWILRRRSAAS
jgi:O-antigen/teichoic acid export membrane protein